MCKVEMKKKKRYDFFARRSQKIVGVNKTALNSASTTVLQYYRTRAFVSLVLLLFVE